jgi:flagellin-like hook-associated protein FlgL
LDSSNIELSLQNIAQARAVNGAEQSRLRIASALNSTNKENRESALSGIQDADIAGASADLAKLKVSIETGSSLFDLQKVAAQRVLRLLE